MTAPPSARRATRVIAISEAAKARPGRDARARRRRRSTSRRSASGVDDRVAPRRRRPTLRAALRARRRAGACCRVAQKREHKNLARLIRALALARGPRRRCSCCPARRRRTRTSCARWPRSSASRDRVRFPAWLSGGRARGPVPAGRRASCSPSFEEGFGLPILEAMGRGVPVACSNTSSLPEVAGDAAELFDPRSAEDIAARDRAAAGRRRAPGELVVPRPRRAVASSPGSAPREATLATYRRAIARAAADEPRCARSRSTRCSSTPASPAARRRTCAALVPALAAERPGPAHHGPAPPAAARARCAPAGWRRLARVVALPADEGQRLRRLRGEQLAVPRRARAAAARRAALARLHRAAASARRRTCSRCTTSPSSPPDALPPSSAFAFRQLTCRARRAAPTALIAGLGGRARRDLPRARARSRDASPSSRTAPGGARGATPAPAGGGARAARPAAAAGRALRRRDAAAQEPGAARARRCAQLPERRRRSCSPAIREGYDARAAASWPAALGVADRVRFPGYLDDAELEALWRLADCAAFPTRAEGFGLPVAGGDAPRRAGRVLGPRRCCARSAATCRATSTPTTRPAPPPRSPRAMATRDAAARGPARAARFTWEAAAQRHARGVRAGAAR